MLTHTLPPISPADAARFDRLAALHGCLHTLSIADRIPLSDLLPWTQLPHIAPWIASLTDILAHAARQAALRAILAALDTPNLNPAHAIRLATAVHRLLHPPRPRAPGAGTLTPRAPSPPSTPRPTPRGASVSDAHNAHRAPLALATAPPTAGPQVRSVALSAPEPPDRPQAAQAPTAAIPPAQAPATPRAVPLDAPGLRAPHHGADRQTHHASAPVAQPTPAARATPDPTNPHPESSRLAPTPSLADP